MRKYLYIWNNPKERFVVASGIEFAHIAASLRNILLLKHGYDFPDIDPTSRFEYVTEDKVGRIAGDSVGDYGDFCWAEFEGPCPGKLSKQTIAELLYFAHTSEIFDSHVFESLRGRFLGFAHDDGWFLKLYYTDWSDVLVIIERKLRELRIEQDVAPRIKQGKEALFVKNGSFFKCERTLSIDDVLNRYLKAQQDAALNCGRLAPPL